VIPIASESKNERTLIDELLAEQGQLTAVEKFSRRHDRHEIPLQQKFYRDLIPLTAPGPGEQFGFEVDLDVCSGCKACVTACHSLNGLDDGETWRKVGTLRGGTRSQPFQQTVTTACHHCVDPGCLNGCPVEAYEKDFTTGIVRHLDDQCIGCQYCSMTCPYDVPQYSKARGIVRKCDMCASRLAVGEAPACVQACPNGAIAVRITSKETLLAAAQNTFLPTAPDSKLTIPSTRYLSAKPLPQTLTAENNKLRLQPAHLPLVFMLVLTQMAAGILLIDCVGRLFSSYTKDIMRLMTLSGWGIACLGLLASVLHLGRPLQAWRSFLGWRHSWLSREIMVFGGFVGFATATAALSFARPVPALFQNLASASACTAALVGVFCSGMVYHATKREFWKLRFTGTKFFGTTVVLGTATLWSVGALYSAPWAKHVGLLFMAATLVKLGFEVSFFKILDRDDELISPLAKSADLLRTKLRYATGARLISALFGGVFLPFFYFTGEHSWSVALLGATLCLIGEFLERHSFFTAVAPPQMPGAN
jgi:formate dehydrogenase iron-sulfur subunit